jgi:hypothetical protein
VPWKKQGKIFNGNFGITSYTFVVANLNALVILIVMPVFKKLGESLPTQTVWERI